jgi:hypothetical protein
MYIHRVAKLVRKQVYLTAEQDEWLAKVAARERRPEAEIIRAALDARIRPQRVPKAAPTIPYGRSSRWRLQTRATSPITSTTISMARAVDEGLVR